MGDTKRLLLSQFASNRYSQHGEDGIIAKIFECIGTSSRVCVEFGAWDGYHLSNTAALWTQGWKGVLIEGHDARFLDLQKNVDHYDCICIHAYVRKDGPDRLEMLLAKSGITGAIDLLSIDIDGDDYYILESLESVRPRVIVCEYNPTIPAHLDLHAPYGSYFGASVAALTRMAEGKGYVLVALTHTNCFFVRADELAGLAGFDFELARMRVDDSLVYLITSYAGDYVASKAGPYGYGFPYREVLIGPHHRLPFRSLPARAGHGIWKAAKRMAKRVLGHK